LPQHDGLTYVGLTDEPLGTDVIPDVPEPAEGEVGFLLDVVSSVLAEPLSRADVLGAYAGLRPLLDASGRTADLSRRHAVLTSPDGVVTVVGGKLTTYRRMAQDAVDTVVGQRSLAAGPCRTRRLPLVGAGDTRALRATGDPARLPARLIDRYGVEAGAVAASPDLLAPISASIPVTHAELRWGVEHEGALDVDDLLDRRTRIGLVPADRARAIPAALAALRSPDGTGPGATAWGSTGTA
ncbi:MAG TPA: glycerol-3-phosphate dehydrogenase C-terminal domain-containing protein, partial [Candidatus Lustribacter sp.]|nr:glycerol-3-phosphate dehydrogenase C-terminal domain-containing protein [Candidatus Lustribacter sp.]